MGYYDPSGYLCEKKINEFNAEVRNYDGSRLEYLREKYGKIDIEDLEKTIELKQTVLEYIEENSKDIIKKKTTMISKVWDSNKQNIVDSYTGLSGKKSLNSFLSDVQSTKNSLYIHEDIIESFRKLADKKGITLDENVLKNANQGFLSNVDKEYLNKMLKDISNGEFWSVINCGYIRAVNEALINGASKNDLLGVSYNVLKKRFDPRCRNCEITTEGVKWYLEGFEQVRK